MQLKKAEHPSQLPEDEYLTPAELFELQNLLVDRANALMAANQETVHKLTADREQDADSLDIASSESDRDFSLRLAGRERRMLKKIQYALRCVDEGEYGTCEHCGEAIGFKRLKVRPVARGCIDCKTQAEQLERRSRAI